MAFEDGPAHNVLEVHVYMDAPAANDQPQFVLRLGGYAVATRPVTRDNLEKLVIVRRGRIPDKPNAPYFQFERQVVWDSAFQNTIPCGTYTPGPRIFDDSEGAGMYRSWCRYPELKVELAPPPVLFET